jgi:DNA repair photolyase
MRKCLEILSQHDCEIQLITKSNLVVRDIDLLKKMPSMVSLTITTDSDSVAKLIEPHAPLPSQRLKAVETLINKGVPTSVRIDPIIPFVNHNTENLIKTLASLGVKHITVSTYKAKLDNWQRFSIALPKIAEKLKPLYFEKGEKIGGYIYLPKALRLKLMKTIGTLAKKHNMKFGTCREGLSHLNTAICDGSWLLKRR